MGEIVAGNLVAGFTFNHASASTNYNGLTVVRNRDGERTTTSALSFTGELGLTQNFGISVSTAYAWVLHQTLTDDSAVGVDGPTDLTLGVMYDVLGDGESGQTSSIVLTPYLGLRIPIGNSGGPLVHSAHAGIASAATGEDIRTTNGTFSPIVGASAIFYYPEIFRNAVHAYFSPELYENDALYRPGSAVSVSINTFTKPIRLKHFSFSPHLSLDYAYVGRAKRQGRPIINSGSHTVSVTPQVMLGWNPGGHSSSGEYSLGIQVPINVLNYRYGSDYYQYEGQLVGLYSVAVTLMGERDFF